ncbi:MAG: hypothetical protein J1F39_01190 [Clostridiales bacterium]|nr:hypothetical protein [Clostridiales bacterium]
MDNKRQIEKITYKGDTFYLIDGKIVDEHFIVPAESIQAEVATFYLSQINYKFLPIDKAKEFMISAKDNGAYGLAYNAGLYYLEERDLMSHEIRLILPIFISICRKMGKIDQAIEYAEKYIAKSSAYSSPALFTSLAAAYCDKGEYVKARTICNRAYAMQGGGVGFTNELSLVYKRIEKALEGR